MSTVASQLPPNPAVDAFARVMTGLYATLQAAAGGWVGAPCMGGVALLLVFYLFAATRLLVWPSSCLGF